MFSSLAVGIWNLAETEKERSRTSAFLLVPRHSNPRRGRGNLEDGKQAKTTRELFTSRERQTESGEGRERGLETEGNHSNSGEKDRKKDRKTQRAK